MERIQKIYWSTKEAAREIGITIKTVHQYIQELGMRSKLRRNGNHGYMLTRKDVDTLMLHADGDYRVDTREIEAMLRVF